MEIRPQGDGALIAQEHQIQRAELGEKKERASHRHQAHDAIPRPLRRGQAAHRPAHHLSRRVIRIGQVDNKAGESGTNGGECRTGQQQLDGRCPPADIGQGDDRHGDAKGAEERHHTDIVAAKGCPHTQQHCHRGAQGGAGGDAQDIGIRQGIFHDGLHHHAADGQRHSNRRGQNQPRQSDQPDHIVHGGARRPRLREGGAQKCVAKPVQQNCVDIG